MEISQTVHIIEVLENFLEKRRPPEELRKRLDLGYRIQGESIFILEIRPSWNGSGRVIEHEVAKATFVKSREHWKIFWKRADMKWHSYEPFPTAKSVEEFVNIVSEDSIGCFWG
jgi:hypothetical protein